MEKKVKANLRPILTGLNKQTIYANVEQKELDIELEINGVEYWLQCTMDYSDSMDENADGFKTYEHDVTIDDVRFGYCDDDSTEIEILFDDHVKFNSIISSIIEF